VLGVLLSLAFADGCLCTKEAVGHGINASTISFAGSTGVRGNLIFMSRPGTNFPWIVLVAGVAASVFTAVFGFIQIKAFSHRIAGERRLFRSDDAVEVSHFQALTTALSGLSVWGTSRRVAVGVGIGGTGATFLDDLLLAGLLGHGIKFTE